MSAADLWPNSARRQWLDKRDAMAKTARPRGLGPAPLPFDQRQRRNRARAVWAEIKPVIDTWLLGLNARDLERLLDLHEHLLGRPYGATTLPASEPVRPAETPDVPF